MLKGLILLLGLGCSFCFSDLSLNPLTSYIKDQTTLYNWMFYQNGENIPMQCYIAGRLDAYEDVKGIMDQIDEGKLSQFPITELLPAQLCVGDWPDDSDIPEQPIRTEYPDGWPY